MALAYRYNSLHYGRLNSGRRGVGAALTVGLHVVVVAMLLLARQHTASQPTPMAVTIFADAPRPQQERPLQHRPELARDVAKLHVPQPEILLAEPAPSSAIVASTTPPPPATAVQAPPAPSQPRFDADYLNNPKPQYPPLSRRLREEGTVMLRVFVLPTGLPDAVELKRSSGSARLDEVALMTVRQWRFVPARAGETTVGAWVVVPIAFSLAT